MLRGRKLRLFSAGFFCVLLLAVGAAAQSVPLWGRWEQQFEGPGADATATQFFVELTSPSGRPFNVAGFWDGGSTWRARFMPTEAGTWKYRTRSTPAVAGLDGRTGAFLCRKATGNNPFQQHGPIRVSSNGRFFEHADGTPFLWTGDTVWYGAILSSEPDWNAYLADRADKRFNVVHFNVVAPRNGVAADENGEVSFEGAERLEIPPSRYARVLARALKLAGFGEQASIRLNPRFYQRLDKRIDAVNSHGLLAAVVLTWAARAEDSGNALSEANVIRLMRYIVSRYGAHHVVWILTGDTTYEGAGGERWKRIGRAVFDGRPHAPVSTHPNSLRWPWERFRDESWLDFFIYQSGHGDDANALRWIHSGPVAQNWENARPRPVINLEPPYEGHLGYQSGKPHTDYTTRRAIYWSLLNAPTAGVTYGAHGVWSWHTAVGRPPTDHPWTGVAKTWREALSFPGSTQMKHLEKFFTSIAWWTLRPAQDLIAQQPGGDDAASHVSAARSENGDLAVFYLPIGGKLKLRSDGLKNISHAEWFNPRTGGSVAVKWSRQRILAAPDRQDWVLRLSAK